MHCFGAPRSSPLVAAAYHPWEALQGGRPEDAALAAMSVDLAMARGLDGVGPGPLATPGTRTWPVTWRSSSGTCPTSCTTHSLEPLRPWKAEQLGRRLRALPLLRAHRPARRRRGDRGLEGDAPRRARLLPGDRSRPRPRHPQRHRRRGVPPRPRRRHPGPPRHRPATGPWSSSSAGSRARRGSTTCSAPPPASTGRPSWCCIAGSPDTPEIAAETGRSATRRGPQGASVVWIEEMMASGAS